ncbi:MAG: CHAT domain-containing tetratricopeptide repeat protein [Candidatus Eisenbacteria bacterium]
MRQIGFGLIHVTFALFLILFVPPAVAFAQAPDALLTRAELNDRIEAQRIEGDYAASASTALELLELTRGDTLAQRFEIEDAERLSETLHLAAGLPDGERARLATADSLAHEGELMWEAGRFSDGIGILKRELELRRGVLGDEHSEVATSLNNLAALMARQGDLAGAEVLYLEALELKRKVLGEAHPEVALSLNNAASLRHAEGDYETAEALLREAVELLTAAFGEEDPLAAATLLNLAGVMRSRGNYADAEPLYRKVLAVRRRVLGGDHPQVAEAMNALASVLKARGDYSGAEPLYREAFAIRRRHLGESHPATAQSLNNLAAFLYAQGSYGESEPLFREALEIRKRSLGANHPEVAQSLNNLAAALYAQDNYAAAEPLYEQALEMRRELLGAGHPSYASSLYNLGVLQKAKGDYEAARGTLRESLERRRVLLGDEHPETATSLYNLGEVNYFMGRYARADSMYRESLAVRRLALGNEHPHVAVTLHRMGVSLKVGGDYAAAEPVLEEACLAYDAARLRAGAGVSKATFLKSPYADLAETKLALGKMEEAWPPAERFLARTLTDLLITASVRDLTDAELAREDSLETRLAGRERDLSGYRMAARSDETGEAAALVVGARTALLEAEADWSAFQREMSDRYPVSEGREATLADVQRTLGESAAIIGWLDAEAGAEAYESWGYVIRREGPVFWAHLGRSGVGPVASVYESFRALGEALSDPESTELGVRIDAAGLWSARMAPLVPALEGVRDLIVVPSGATLGVPVETLVAGDGALLGERFAVSYVPSSTLYAWLTTRAARAGSGKGSLLLGDPPFCASHLAEMPPADAAVSAENSPDGDSGSIDADGLVSDAEARDEKAVAPEAIGPLAVLPRLPGTRDEVLALQGVIDGPVVLLGPDASEEALVEFAESGRMSDFDILHLATHAHVDDRVPGRSALVLSQVGLPDPIAAVTSGDRVFDGILTAREIVSEWDLGADLVTLSACETALGREVGGEGYIGLAHAFLQAGARSLLVSLWKVEDRATSLLMTRFYENLTGRGSGAGAAGDAGTVGGVALDGATADGAAPMPKAEALREAKLWLREYTDEAGARPYHHPFFWSAFVLMGDRS